MQQIKIYILALMSLVMWSGCIEEYKIDDALLEDGIIVISGKIEDQAGTYTVEVSRSVDLEYRQPNPVSGCYVELQDSLGNSFEYQEVSAGEYQVSLEADDLIHGMTYRLIVFSPEGGEYHSDYEVLLGSPEVGEVYGERDDQETTTPGEIDQGVQFYYDFDGTETEGRYYRIQLEETWEYHAEYPIYYEYYGGPRRSDIGLAYYTCYRTAINQNIYTMNTKGLDQNVYTGFTMNWESRTTQKFNHKYSILLRQYALSESTYQYWKAMEENGQESGGLYDKQPISLPSNIHNISNEEEKVLGYFSVMGVNEKRFMFEDNFGLTYYNLPNCDPYVDEDIGMRPPSVWPIYMVEVGAELMVASDICFDCREKGGTTVKPDFW